MRDATVGVPLLSNRAPASILMLADPTLHEAFEALVDEFTEGKLVLAGHT